MTVTRDTLACTVIRSARRSLSIEVGSKGMIVRAPLRTTDRQIDTFIRRHKGWIEKQLQKLEQRQARAAAVPPLTAEELRELKERAAQYIPGRVEHYAPLVGVTYEKITVRAQRTKWGSCSAKGNLSFNCLLMLAPPEVIDSIVVHELCHRKAMDHSDRFYREVLRVFPAYRTWDKWLKNNGSLLMARMTNMEPDRP